MLLGPSVIVYGVMLKPVSNVRGKERRESMTRKKKMIKWKVIDHWDVWGNATDGYDVNDSMHVGEIYLEEDFDTQDVLEAMVEAGYLNEDLLERDNALDIKIEWETYIEIDDASDGKPLFSLELDNPPPDEERED